MDFFIFIIIVAIFTLILLAFDLKDFKKPKSIVVYDGNEEVDQKVLDRVVEHYNYLKSQGYDVIFTALQGSQNYGLDDQSNDYSSDVDTKSAILPSFEDVVYNRTPISTVAIMPENGEHAEVKDIRIMIEMWRKENISYIELLYSKYIVINPEYEDLLNELIAARDAIAAINKNQFLRCIKGMALEKQKALCHPYPNLIDKIEKYGFDGKQLSHAMRLEFFLEDLLCQNKTMEQCYRMYDHLDTFQEMRRQLLKNLKKQKDYYGEIISCDNAILIMNDTIDNIKAMTDKYLECNDSIDQAGIAALNSIKYRMLKRKFKKEILND